jgi:hydrogenase-4 component F
MAYLLIALPLVMAAVTFAVPSNRWRPWLLPLGGLAYMVLVLGSVFAPADTPPVSGLDGWLLLDPLGKVVLGFLSVLFFLCSLYAPAYLALRSERANRVFCANLFASLAMMTLVVLSHHLGLMWVAMEATTLLSAPWLYFNQNPRSLEATWKYLLIGSVGIALALFGTFFLAYSSLKAREANLPVVTASTVGLMSSPLGPGPFLAAAALLPGRVPDSTLLFDQLVIDGPFLSAPWLHAAFVLLFIGYGTKMGLAPMHTWKPDAYGEAPGVVGALLAGGVTSCAFIAVLRVYHITSAGPDPRVSREIMIFMGLLSMAVAAVFMVRQRDFKRMLAYSSVEHMGILVLGIGIGGVGGVGAVAVYGALLHLVNNGLTKGVLFLSAGNIHRAYGSKLTTGVRGALRRVPLSGALFLAGFLAITGSPPFGPFVSEFTIVNAAVGSGQFLAAGLFLVLLCVVFIGMGVTVLAVVQGDAPEEAAAHGYRDTVRTCGPILLFMALVLCLGLYIPPAVDTLLRDAAAFLEVKR